MAYELKRSRYSSHTRLLEVFSVKDGGTQVLDVGGGEGYMARALTARGYSVTCVCQPGTIQDGLNRTAQVVEADLNHGFPDLGDSFSYAICGDVLEHLVDPLGALRWVRRYLSPQGKLVASLPNSANIYFRANVLIGRFPQHEKGLFDRTHLHYYAWENWKQLLHQAGFSILSNTPTAIPFGAMWPERAATAPVQTLEGVSYVLARVWKTLWAYQFVVLAQVGQVE